MDRTLHFQSLKPPSNKKLFPVQRPGGLKRADLDFFFMIFEKSVFFSQSSWYILVNEKLKTEKKEEKSRPPDWLYWQSRGGQETIFHLI